MTTQAQLQIDADDALVLFEFLARFDATERLEIQDASETAALRHLHAALEKGLVAPLSAEYAVLLEQARSRVRDRSGM